MKAGSGAISRMQRDNTLRQFTEAIVAAASLLENMRVLPQQRQITTMESLPSLLEQCKALTEKAAQQGSEPIRTIHHFACTGGTLISKCLASLPNTQLLSEVNPFSAQALAGNEDFFPTDLLRLVSAGSRDVDDELLGSIFLRGLEAIYENAQRNGLRLILRDHAHSHFAFVGGVLHKPTLRELVARKFATVSVVTVRHPIDSYLSLRDNGWMHFKPGGIEEYARRYISFLDRYEGVEIFRYEDFVEDPERVVESMCKALALVYDPSFLEIFPAQTLSGDSGRSGDTIAPRTRREVDKGFLEEAVNATSMYLLCNRLNYEL